MREIRVK